MRGERRGSMVAQAAQDVRSLWKVIGLSTFIASLCCLPSVVLVMFGLASVGTAAALSDTLYWGLDGYWWVRPSLLIVAACCVGLGLYIHFRNQGICTLDEVVRQRRRVVNTTLLIISVSVASYLLFNHVILTEVGIALDLPWESSRFWT